MSIGASLLATPVRALRVEQTDGKVSAALVTLKVADLSPGNVLVRVAYAGLNYKDALATTTEGKVIRNFPRIGGIDLAGTVIASEDPAFAVGDGVLSHSRGNGVEIDGGFATHARLPGGFVHRMPQGLSLAQAGALGVAGYSAALCVELLEEQGVHPQGGPVLVNGATGAVAGMAIDMLASRGYTVVAMSSKAASAPRLLALGAAEVVSPALTEETRPLASARWQAAIDSVGGRQLDWTLRSMQPRGVIASLGNASGNAFGSNVLPLILRGARIVGVNAMVYIDRQAAIWRRLASDLLPRRALAQSRTITLDELPAQLQAMLAGTADGRSVVSLAD